MSKLYVVGTPIGNLGDMSPRAIETLKNVDFIAAEDTRVTLKLLNHFGIQKPMISYYEHNLRQKGEVIISRILAGESCAVVTDAGMPCISDPGEDLIRLCIENGVKTEVVPGPSAVISALAVSGQLTSRFTFEGFLTTQKNGRREHLEQLKNETRTMIFYEAPHKLKTTLEDMRKTFGGERGITLCRELTKIYEEIIPTTFDGAIALYEEKAPKGEYVLVVAGGEPVKETEMTLDEAVQLAVSLREGGMSLTQACKEAAAQTGFKKGEIYKLALEV